MDKIIHVIIVILLCLLVIYIIYTLLRPRCSPKFRLEASSNSLFEKYNVNNSSKIKLCPYPHAADCKNDSHKTAVLFKSHTWNLEIENFVVKLKCDIDAVCNVDLYILLHSEDGKLLDKINNRDLRSLVTQFKEREIRDTYNNKGFHSMWLSNHWIVMWFWHKFSDKYDYVWSIEYDVRISGDSRRLWEYPGTEDFLYPIKPFQDSKWLWKDHYVGKMTDDDKWYGYLQLARYSRLFLNYLDEVFTSGENGQDEMMLFSLLKRGGDKFRGSHYLLNPLIKDSWTVHSEDSDRHKGLFRDSENKPLDKRLLTIYHPVK